MGADGTTGDNRQSYLLAHLEDVIAADFAAVI
jgi:hypothetical protein